MSGIELRSDIPYLGAGRAERLDAYLPPPGFARPAPAVLLIHGGGWRIGDKADARERNIGGTLAAHGYAVFSVNYLLNSNDAGEYGTPSRIAWPQNIIDCLSALRHIRAHAAAYGIDPRRVAVMGGSAGGHLAMLIGATAHLPDAIPRGDLHADQDVDVACVVSLYGVHDVRGRRAALFGSDPAVTAQASPATWFSQRMPPILVVHGSADTLVPVEDSRALVELLRRAGVDYQYVEIAGAPHSFHLEPAQMDLRPLVLGFLARHLGAPVRS